MKKIEETESSIPIEMLPYLNKFKGKTFVIKYGGSVMKNKIAQEAFFNDVATLKNMNINIVIVHGGGPENQRGSRNSLFQPRGLHRARHCPPGHEV